MEGDKPCTDPERCNRVVFYTFDGKTLKRLREEELKEKLTAERGSCATFIERLSCGKVRCLLVGENFFGKGALYTMAYYGIELGEIGRDGEPESSLRGGVCKTLEDFLKPDCGKN